VTALTLLGAQNPPSSIRVSKLLMKDCFPTFICGPAVAAPLAEHITKTPSEEHVSAMPTPILAQDAVVEVDFIQFVIDIVQRADDLAAAARIELK
jgi:hypothetical protein